LDNMFFIQFLQKFELGNPVVQVTLFSLHYHIQAFCAFQTVLFTCTRAARDRIELSNNKDVGCQEDLKRQNCMSTILLTHFN
jgi:hypothetical protein